AEAEQKRVYPRIVVRVRLGEFHVHGQRPKLEDVYELVRIACPEALRSDRREPDLPTFDDLRQAGRLIVLFDGMDEMSRERYNEHTLALSTFAKVLSDLGGKCIVTCRIDEFDPALHHQRLVLLAFDRRQIKGFLTLRFPQERTLPVHGERWTLG